MRKKLLVLSLALFAVAASAGSTKAAPTGGACPDVVWTGEEWCSSTGGSVCEHCSMSCEISGARIMNLCDYDQ